MRATVLKDAALTKQAGRFVWLSVDTEKERNVDFIQKFPVDNWPTFFVIDSVGETAALKWLGTANVAQLEKLMDDGEQAIRTTSGKDPDQLLASADRAFAAGQRAEGAKLYRESLDKAPPSWPRRPRAVESLVTALQGAADQEGCARAAMRETASLAPGSSFANAAATGLTCALSAPASAGWRGEAIALLEPRVRQALSFPDLLADDRSGLYDVLVQSREAQGDKEGTKQAAADWLRFLEGEAARAPTPEARSAFDSHRLAAALKLGEPGRVVAPLQSSERDLPQDYNPPARLAIAYSALGRYDDALAAADRALSRVYGPRRIRVLQSKANIYAKKGDPIAAQRTLEEAVQFAETLPVSQRSEKTIERLRAEAAKAGQAASR